MEHSNDVCCVCLDIMNEKQYHKKLSCGHTIHFQCFRKMVFRKNIYIACPICRVKNTDICKPSNDPYTNIRLLCSSKVGNTRCLCKTKRGTVCKRKSKLLNYGFCHQHNPNVLKESMYPLMETYMYLILLQRNSWETKLKLFDIGKQIIINYCDESSQLQDLLSYFYQYMTIKDVYQIRDYDGMYEYYKLKKPNSSWLKFCQEKYIII